MDLGNVRNNGKWQAWEDLGYAVTSPEGRSSAAQHVINQMRGQMTDASDSPGRSSSFGPKAGELDLVRITADVIADFTDEVIPAGTEGTVVEVYTSPQEGYAVDLALPAPELVGNYRYHNVILDPTEFEVVEGHDDAETQGSSRA